MKSSKMLLDILEDTVVNDENDLDFENPDDNENDIIQDLTRLHDVNISPVMLLVPIGATAFNIHNDVYYFVIDKKVRSVVTCLLWYLRLRQAFQKYGIRVFGGRSVILVGNFGQLPPVLDEPMYSQVLRFDSLSNDAIRTRDLLLRLRDGDSIEDVRFSNAPDVLASLESARFSDSTCIMPCDNDARKADSDVAKGLLSRNLRVMFTAQVNLWADTGLVNGSVGVVQEIVFEENQGPPFFPIAILVEFDTYSGPASDY
ncbi:ATP-dependent DNA helicase PIF1-like [Rhizophagus irregularis DAOM 181602=DAOM 197198]|nr:ATP-dependent DNA helicase PIF1-like [Rhizophagus irregularis DAOM 181602=DAOM 197198]